MRQTDIGGDHDLVIAKVRLKLRRAKIRKLSNLRTQKSENLSTSSSETNTAYSKMSQPSLSTNFTRS